MSLIHAGRGCWGISFCSQDWWVALCQNVESSVSLNSSNDHNKLPKQAGWLSFDCFFEGIWEAKAQERHITLQITKAKAVPQRVCVSKKAYLFA